MKSLKKLAFTAALLFGLVLVTSCNSVNPLKGTTWSCKYTDSESGITYKMAILDFTSDSDVTLKSATGETDTDGNLKYTSYYFSYSYDDPTVTISGTIEGESGNMNGQLDGDSLTLTAGGRGITFTKD